MNLKALTSDQLDQLSHDIAMEKEFRAKQSDNIIKLQSSLFGIIQLSTGKEVVKALDHSGNTVFFYLDRRNTVSFRYPENNTYGEALDYILRGVVLPVLKQYVKVGGEFHTVSALSAIAYLSSGGVGF